MRLRRTRGQPARQQVFAFRARLDRLDRGFRWGIGALTLAVLCGILGATSTGRYLSSRVAAECRLAVLTALGQPETRTLTDELWRLKRTHGVKETAEFYRSLYPSVRPIHKRLFEYAGLDPDHALFRWGNYNRILILPSTVFTADDTGRSYRMKPRMRSVWVKDVPVPGNLPGFALVPDSPELPRLLAGTGAWVVPGSEQTTNSWGLRGPEPDLRAPLRGLVLGDSNMQGLYIGDDETPPACLQRDLERRLKTRVSIVNTGHLGYSPEQFYYSLREYGPRVRPHFILLSFCPNDFGNGDDVINGKGDLVEGKHWLDLIVGYCNREQVRLIVAPVPFEGQVVALYREGHYPGSVANIGSWSALSYCNPLDDFINEFLRLKLDGERSGHPISGCPLFNDRINDPHFSARGAEVWARAVGRRVALLLELERLRH